MKNEIKKIEIGKGVGAVKFGMVKAQVEAILGKPNDSEIEKDFETGDAVETCDYDEFGISFSYDEEEDWKLETITINSDFYELNGVSLIGKTIEQVQDFIEENELGEMAYEDFSTHDLPDHELIDVDEANMFFWFSNNICTEIQMGVFWDENDNALWAI